jgi:oligopeptide/dipeptide ABC transporter ATP-binding protein
MALLEVRNLRTTFATAEGEVKAVDGVSFRLERGQVLGVVGESGSGKSVTGLSLMGLLPKSAGVTGEIVFGGQNVLAMSPKARRAMRGNEMSMIFQEPMTSLNPVYTIGWQVQESILLHNNVTRAQARARCIEMLTAVGIPAAAQRLSSYPHEFSGGMRQRVMIAMALANSPALLIADEPTTALDVTTQAQVLAVLRRLRRDMNSAVILITHDLGVVAELCDEVLVMYGGRVVEYGPVVDVLQRPQHPYTWGLLGSLPSRARESGRLLSIAGSPPNLLRPPAGCRFHPRCGYAMDICRVGAAPDPQPTPGGSAIHVDACHLPADFKNREMNALLNDSVARA